MRKEFLCLGIILFTIVSCQKKDNIKINGGSNNNASLKIKNGHLAFSGTSEYESFVNKSTMEKEKSLNGLVNRTSFINFSESKQDANQNRTIHGCDVPDTLIENNEEFFETLDEDGVVQIDNTIYRYDYCNDGVWTISETNASNETYYSSFMSGTEITNIVGFFPSYVGVTDAIEAGYTTMPNIDTVIDDDTDIFVSKPIFNNALEEYYINNPENARYDGKIGQENFGIWHTLYAKEKYQEPCFFNWCTSSSGPRDWYVDYKYKYVARKQSQITEMGTLSPPSSGENKVTKDIYRGVRRLTKFYVNWAVNYVPTIHYRIVRSYLGPWTTIINTTFGSTTVTNNYPYSLSCSCYLYFLWQNGY